MRIYGAYLSLIVFLTACRKDAVIDQNEIAGDWNWKATHATGIGSFGTATPTGSTPTLISFNENRSFIAVAICLFPGPTQGTYEIKSIDISGTQSKVLILKSAYADTFRLSIADCEMTLAEIRRRGRMVHVHEFTRK